MKYTMVFSADDVSSILAIEVAKTCSIPKGNVFSLVKFFVSPEGLQKAEVTVATSQEERDGLGTSSQ